MMQKYRLKKGQPPFEPVEGVDAGKIYRSGKTYPAPAVGHESKFEKVVVKTKKTTKKSADEVNNEKS